MNKKTVMYIISGLVVIVLAIVLIISITTNPGANIVKNPDKYNTTSPVLTESPEVSETDQTDTGSKVPSEQSDPDDTPTAFPTEPGYETEIPDGEDINDRIIQLDELNIAGADNINVVDELGKDIADIYARKGDPDFKEIFYASDAYIYSDITYITPYEEGEIIKIFARAPYKFNGFKIGDSVENVTSMFDQPRSKGYSEEDELWLMEYKVEYNTEQYIINFYAESEFGTVVAIGIEKNVLNQP